MNLRYSIEYEIEAGGKVGAGEFEDRFVGQTSTLHQKESRDAKRDVRHPQELHAIWLNVQGEGLGKINT